MRPTSLQFRHPNERTGGYTMPEMTTRGTRLTVKKKDRKSCIFNREERFSHITELVRRTAPRVGPGAYNNHVSHERVRSQAVMRKTYADADEEYDYTVINDAVIKFKPRRNDNLRFSTIQYPSQDSTMDQQNHSYALDRSISYSNQDEDSPHYTKNRRPQSAAKKRDSPYAQKQQPTGSNLRNSGTLNVSFGVAREDPLNKTAYFEKRARPKSSTNANKKALNKSMDMKNIPSDAKRKMLTKNTTKKTTAASTNIDGKSFDNLISKQTSTHKTNSSLNLDDLETSTNKEFSIDDIIPHKRSTNSAASKERQPPIVLEGARQKSSSSKKPQLSEFSLRPEVKREISEMAARYFGLDTRGQKVRYY